MHQKEFVTEGCPICPLQESVMTTANRKKRRPGAMPKATEEMAKYGITHVPIDYFHYEQYRYTNLADALAQAKRAQPSD
jgi:hypothetical protein